MKDRNNNQEYLLQDDSGNINPEDFTAEMNEAVKEYMDNFKLPPTLK